MKEPIENKGRELEKKGTTSEQAVDTKPAAASCINNIIKTKEQAEVFIQSLKQQ